MGKEKKCYSTPKIELIELEATDMILTSGDGYEDFGGGEAGHGDNGRGRGKGRGCDGVAYHGNAKTFANWKHGC